MQLGISEPDGQYLPGQSYIYLIYIYIYIYICLNKDSRDFPFGVNNHEWSLLLRVVLLAHFWIRISCHVGTVNYKLSYRVCSILKVLMRPQCDMTDSAMSGASLEEEQEEQSAVS